MSEKTRRTGRIDIQAIPISLDFDHEGLNKKLLFLYEHFCDAGTASRLEIYMARKQEVEPTRTTTVGCVKCSSVWFRVKMLLKKKFPKMTLHEKDTYFAQVNFRPLWEYATIWTSLASKLWRFLRHGIGRTEVKDIETVLQNFIDRTSATKKIERKQRKKMASKLAFRWKLADKAQNLALTKAARRATLLKLGPQHSCWL